MCLIKGFQLAGAGLVGWLSGWASNTLYALSVNWAVGRAGEWAG